jgi:hypothetical protein
MWVTFAMLALIELAGWETVPETVVVQPCLSVIVALYVPAPRDEMVELAWTGVVLHE